MKITVIGHICQDIFSNKKNEKQKTYWGGIYYCILTFANICSNEDIVCPVFPIFENDYDEIISVFQKYPNINTDGIYKTQIPTNTVYINSSSKNRIECSTSIAESIPFKKIQPFLKSDGILLNMISGFDITLDTLDLIRIATREQNNIKHIDFHSLGKGVGENGIRFFQSFENWRRWAFSMNSVQMNYDEMKNFLKKNEDENYFAKQILSLDVNNFVITNGSKGAILYSLYEKNIIRNEIAISEKIENVDTIGCGDVFSAAYLYAFLKNRNPIESVNYANLVASQNSIYIASSQIENLKNIAFEKVNINKQL